MKSNFIFLSTIIFVISIAIVDSQESFADSYNIGITLDKTCLALISLNDTETCPSYEKINSVFANMKLQDQYLDLIASEQDIGKIIKNNNIIENHSKQCILYEQCNVFSLNTGFWLNPSEYLSRSMDVITITPHMKIKNPLQLTYENITTITEDNKRQITFKINQLYVSDNCKDAIFSPGLDWQFELAYLVRYMYENCENIEQLTQVFDLTHIEETDIHYFDPLTSPNYQYRLWMDEAKELCKVKC